VGAPIEVHTPFTENGGLDAISAQLLREEVETLTAANERLKEELRHANERTKEVTKASRQQKYLNTILSQQLSESSGNKSRSTQNGNGAVDEPETQTDPLAEFIRQTAALRFTPAEALEALQLLLPANVIVLPSAFKSAKRSEEFRDRKSVFDLLWRLATCYRSNLLAGKGDVEARQAFTTTEFAPHDGEIGERDRKQRCFEYRGERREFQKHLRIGFKESASETLRIYFDFDTSEKKIVIAYCGPHLKY
jgi:hypothetical protein